MRTATVLALVLSGVIAACGVVGESEPRFKGTDITGAQWGRGFDLTDHTGRRRTLADFRGKVVLVFFGYTNCPDACPTALAEMAEVVKRLGPAGNQAQGIFITVDPERDTPGRLASYVPAFHPSFVALRGTPEEVAQIAKEFKVYFRAERTGAARTAEHGSHQDQYMVDHSTALFVFDPQGRIRLYFSANGRSVDAMVHDVKLLLDSRGG